MGKLWRARDGFVGTMIGEYTTREGERGAVLQQLGTMVVHVYRLVSIEPMKEMKDG